MLSLIAAVHGLNLRADFPAVLSEAARLAGVALTEPTRATSTAIETGSTTYPDEGEVSALWRDAYPVEADITAAAYLTSRAVEVEMVDLYDLARVIQPWAVTPTWARCRGKSWASTHRLILPVVDHLGAVRSLRAWQIDGTSDDAPKRTAPAGKALSGLILACPTARRMLATGEAPQASLDVIVTEGEPDFLTWASRLSDANEAPPAVLGVVAGAWCDAIAARIPDGARVIIRTHQDTAGDRYAAEIKATLEGRNVRVLDRKRGRHGAAA